MRLTLCCACVLLVTSVVSGCGAAARREWSALQVGQFGYGKSIAIVSGNSGFGSAGAVPMLKAMVSSLQGTGRYDVMTFRDLLVKFEGSQIRMPPPGPYWHKQLDPAIARKLREKLEVDIVCVVWVVRKGSHGGDAVKMQLFLLDDGHALGSFGTSRGGLDYDVGTGWTGSYDFEANCHSMAEEAAASLERQIK